MNWTYASRQPAFQPQVKIWVTRRHASRPPPPLQIMNWTYASRQPAFQPQVKTWVTRPPAPLPFPPQNLRWPSVPRRPPPQMIDWAAVRASIPEDKMSYRIWEEITGRYSGWRPG